MSDPSVHSDQADRIVLLGTAGGPKLRRDRSQPANLMVVGGKAYLIDCGEGCVTQLAKAGVGPAQVERAFLTHMHLDHTAGIAALAAFRWSEGAATSLKVFGPPGTRQLLEAATAYLAIPTSVHMREVPGLSDVASRLEGFEVLGIAGQVFEVYRDQNIRVRAVENTHFASLRGADIGFGALRSFSYRIDSAARSVVFTGDTGASEALENLARGADVLVCEVMDIKGVLGAFAARGDIASGQLAAIEAQMRAKHLTPSDVGRLANAADVKTVVLTHFAGGAESTENLEQLVAEVRTGFGGEIVVGRDLRSI